MLSLDEIIAMNNEDFAKAWNEDIIQDSCLKLLGDREMTPEEQAELDSKK